jgi:hypothetical protein
MTRVKTKVKTKVKTERPVRCHGYTAYMVMAGVNKHTGVPLSPRPRPLSALSASCQAS